MRLKEKIDYEKDKELESAYYSYIPKKESTDGIF